MPVHLEALANGRSAMSGTSTSGKESLGLLSFHTQESNVLLSSELLCCSVCSAVVLDGCGFLAPAPGPSEIQPASAPAPEVPVPVPEAAAPSIALVTEPDFAPSFSGPDGMRAIMLLSTRSLAFEMMNGSSESCTNHQCCGPPGCSCSPRGIEHSRELMSCPFLCCRRSGAGTKPE